MSVQKIENKVKEALHTANYNKSNGLNHPDSLGALNRMTDDIDGMISGLRGDIESLQGSKRMIKDYLSETAVKANYS